MLSIPEFVTTVLNDSEPSAVSLLEEIITFGITHGVSDIHLCPELHRITVKTRIHGALRGVFTYPPLLHFAVIARLKVVCGLRTDEPFAPHDGRFTYKTYAIRVSIIPSHYGENAVLRLLAANSPYTDLETLGFTKEDQATITRSLERTAGLVLIAGPTGSGKTTTVYALISYLAQRPCSIATVEDPIEYSLPGITQVPVETRGLTFARALRALLRQDPDILVVGEIRDGETAALCIQAALTGHLVLSTIHASCETTARARLMSLGVDASLLNLCLSLFIAQRLVSISDGEGSYSGRKGEFLVTSYE